MSPDIFPTRTLPILLFFMDFKGLRYLKSKSDFSQLTTNEFQPVVFKALKR